MTKSIVIFDKALGLYFLILCTFRIEKAKELIIWLPTINNSLIIQHSEFSRIIEPTLLITLLFSVVINAQASEQLPFK